MRSAGGDLVQVHPGDSAGMAQVMKTAPPVSARSSRGPRLLRKLDRLDPGTRLSIAEASHRREESGRRNHKGRGRDAILIPRASPPISCARPS
jgi:hypothetical protein